MKTIRKVLLCYCVVIEKLVDLAMAVAAALLGLLMAATAVQIVMRSIFNSPIYGIEEGVIAAVVWFAALGSVVVTRQNGHAQVEFFLRFVPKPLLKPVNTLAYVLGAVAGVLMAEGGTRLWAVQVKSIPQGGLPFSRVYYYALPMIVMGVLLVLVCVSRIIRIWVSNEKAREGGDLL